MQRSFAEVDGVRKQRKVTRREAFLAEMARVVPWRRLEGLIEPHYPTGGNRRKPYPLGLMLRVHFLRQWYGYSDPAMEDALHDIPALRRFAGLDAGGSRMPDETTILNFRHLSGGAPAWREPVSGRCVTADGAGPDPARGHDCGRNADPSAALDEEP